jgi:RimJ/RimL family protein N-acetyltransferase/protein tyrosine phosphatase (PTP) superfamily phosphohydrolase (DUF442 family)
MTASDPPAGPGPAALDTPRLRLRPLETADAPFILGLLNEPSWLRFIGDRGVRGLDDARRYVVEGPRRAYATHGYGLMLVERREDGLPQGLCGLIRRDGLADPDVGFALVPSAWGHGYAWEAAHATLVDARATHRLERVVAVTTADNRASQRLLVRLGLRYQRKIRLSGDAAELDLYATTPAFEFDAESVRAVSECLWTSGQLSARDVEQLPALGIDAVVNLALPTSPNALPGEAERVTSLGISYFQIPVAWERPTREDLRRFVGLMDALEGRRVWVHCARNMRVSAFVHLYHRLRGGVGEVAARYPLQTVWEPDGTWRAFIDHCLQAGLEMPDSDVRASENS